MGSAISDQIPLYKWVLTRLGQVGVEPSRALALAGISPARFVGGKAKVSTHEFFSFWQAVDDVSGDPEVGLRLGLDVPTEHYDVASVAALHSAHLGEALAKLARYKRLLCPEEILLTVADGEAALSCRWLLADRRPPAMLTDILFARAVGLARRGLGRHVQALRIELVRRPGREAAWAHLGCEVMFDAPGDRLVFDAALLAEPFLTHNEELLAMLVPGLESALVARIAEDARVEPPAMTLVDQVAALLTRDMRGGKPSVESIARSLAVSPRTLQRRLGALGTSYQQLLDQARQDAARRLLSATELDAGEIAFLLGFEELNSFSRAFQAWEGTTPTRWRESSRH